MKICEIDGCFKRGYQGEVARRYGRVWCRTHAEIAKWNDGNPLAPDVCSVVEDGFRCVNPRLTHGMCKMHHARVDRTGTTDRTQAGPGEPYVWLRGMFDADGTDECFSLPGREPTYHLITLPRGRRRGAHVLVCEWAHGPQPPDHPTKGPYEVCHSCGNGAEGCVNRRHVRWDTRKANVEDTIAAVRHGRQKISDPMWDRIIERVAAGERQTDLADEFGLDQSTISHRWREFATPEQRERAKQNRPRRRAKGRLPDDQRAVVRERYEAGGVTLQKLADEFGVSLSQIHGIVR